MDAANRRESLDVTVRRNFLMLGFYDRGNLGDEAFKMVFPLFFRHIGIYDVDFVFACTDDIDAIPSNTDAVVMAGGDTITPYFMEKITRLLSGYKGPVYGISVGMPYDDDAKFLNIFDHVFVRSQYDASIASSIIGARNVTYMPDITLTWHTTKTFSASNAFVHNMPSQKPGKRTDIGVCLASPLLRAKPHVMEALVSALIEVLTIHPYSKLHFLAFNTNTASVKECDVLVMKEVHDIIALRDDAFRSRMTLHDHACKPLDADKMINKLATMDMVVCMRFHSVMFSYMANTPFVTLSETKKIRTLLDDMQYEKQFVVNTAQASLDREQIVRAVDAMMSDRKGLMTYVNQPLAVTPLLMQRARNVLASTASYQTRYKNVKVKAKPTKTVDSALKRVCTNLGMFTETTIDESVLDKVGPFNLQHKDPLVFARIVCHAITGDVNNRCLWGLKDNLSSPTFKLRDAVHYIFNDYMSMSGKDVYEMLNNAYYMEMPVERRAFAEIDPYACHTFGNVHRSGWSYVVNNMMNIDASHFGRKSDLMIDTFVDQTFHWAKESMVLAGNIPYKRPWMGFLHHTFDTTHSKYNLVALFNEPVFVKSLDTCKCLVALSDYLANQIRAALFSLGPKYHGIRVRSLMHPTMMVAHTFTWEKFMHNPDKKVVQIGAWLRNPYSIYALPLPVSTDSEYNPLKLRKCALKGKQMQNYFMPPDFFVTLYKHCKETESMGGTCGPTEDILCRAYFDNKYINGMYQRLLMEHNSVEAINMLSNEGFDTLLSENIVFLDLVDCSAVNTVIECVVRNTILIVNRHPAVEEVLGKNYPGFYNSLFEAAMILSREDKLKAIYRYMCKTVDKSRLRIESFMEELQDTLNECVDTCDS